MALSVPKLFHEDEETETGTPIRYVPLTHLYSATSPCINTSGASMSKKVKARKLDETFVAEVEIPSQKPSPVLRVYQRRAKRPRIESETGETQRDDTEKVEVFVRVDDGDQNVNLDDEGTANGEKKTGERNFETSKLGVNSNDSRRMSGRARDKRDSLRTGTLKFVNDREKPKVELGSTSVSSKKWVELSFENVDPNVFVGLPCKVYWPLDDRWYTGSVTGYNLESNKHQIGYDDGEIESLILSKEKVKFHVSREDMDRLNVNCSVSKGDKKSQDYDELVALAAAFDDCQELEPGDIIWAKLTGHSMWPAIVVGESNVSACKGLKPMAGERSIPVQFFGTHDFARISMKHVTSFLKGLLSSFHMKCKQARFYRGLEEAKTYLSEQKLPKKMLWEQNGIQADDGDSGSDEEEEVVDSGENMSGDEGVQDCTYPLKVGDLRVISLGRIVRDSEHFHNKKYIWPEGYTAERKYTSTIDPCKSTFYKMEVLRNPQSKGRPLFRVTLDNDLQIAGSTPSACWNKIYKKIDSCNGSHRKEGEMSGTSKSGSYMFGFSIRKISKLIQELPGSGLCSKSALGGLSSKGNLDQPAGYRPVRVDWKDLDKCNVCHMDEEYANNLFLQCDKCRMMVHARCYGEEPKDAILWLCNLCRDEAPRCPPPCCLCPVTGGAMKPTTDGRWAHLTCAMWIPETCLLDVKKMEPIDGLERINKDRWKLLCSICGVSYGACIQCSKSTCRVAYHPLCARAAGLCVELEDEDKLQLTSMDEDEDQQCIRLLSFCKKHRQPSNERPSGVEGKVLAARNCSSYVPPSNPSGCARTEPYNFMGRRGRKEPEALAAASVKRLFVEDRPYLVSGYRQNKSLRVLPSSDELVLTSFSLSKHKMRSSHPETVENILSMTDKYKHMKETFRKRLAFGKSGIHGFGIFAKQAHKAGDMVIEYIGELVRPPVADLREHFIYNSLVGAGTYMFRIDEEKVIDATRAGSIAHLINHSCEPNCYSRMITVHGDDHIIIFAKRDINQWEELTYDYRFFAIEEKLACYCGFPRCRGVVNDIEAEEQVAPLRVPRSELIECTGEYIRVRGLVLKIGACKYRRVPPADLTVSLEYLMHHPFHCQLYPILFSYFSGFLVSRTGGILDAH